MNIDLVTDPASITLTAANGSERRSGAPIGQPPTKARRREPKGYEDQEIRPLLLAFKFVVGIFAGFWIVLGVAIAALQFRPDNGPLNSFEMRRDLGYALSEAEAEAYGITLTGLETQAP